MYGGFYAPPEFLYYHIDPDGATRVLFVSDYVHKKDTDEIKAMEEYHGTLLQTIEKERTKLRRLNTIQLKVRRNIVADGQHVIYV